MLATNSRVCQLNQALIEHLIDKKYNFQWILNKVEDVNAKVTATNFLEMYYPRRIGSTVLHFAADRRDLEAFKILLDYGADYTIKNRDGLTALHLIIKKSPSLLLQGYILDDPFVESVLSAHLKYNKFQNAMDKSGLSHFHLACAANNVKLVQGFLDNGVSIDHIVEMDSLLFPGYSSLHFAAKFCASEMVDLLLSHGANVHRKDAKNMTALHVALERKIEIVRDTHLNETLRDANEKILILLLGKEMNNSLSTGDNWGLSHLHVSCVLNDSKAAEDLLTKNPDINIIVSMDSPLWPGFTPLHFAALGNINTVKLLMKRGADMNIKNAKGVTAFDICIERYKPEDIYTILSLDPVWKKITLSDGETKLTELVFAMRDSNVFEVFLKKLSKSSSICDSPLWPGCSPMHLAVIFAKTVEESGDESVEMNLEILRTLFKQFPVMIYNQDIHGCTPLHLAFELNKKLVIKLLMEFLQECPNLIDCVDEGGLSYVHIASALNNANLIDQLLTMGANVNAAYGGKTAPLISPGSTALHFAVVNSSTGAIETLLKHGANTHMKDACDMTPIHLLLLGLDTSSTSTNKSTEEMGDMLLSPNLQESIVSGVGLSHLHIASWLGKTKVVEHLLNNGSDINCVVTYESSSSEEWSKLKFIKSIAGYSPLLMASLDFNFATQDLLWERGADCLIVDPYDGKPWLYGRVDIEDNEWGWEWLIKCLIKREDLQTRLRVETGMTALHMACLCRNIEDVETALKEGANVNDQININSPILQGYTPLHILIRTWTAIRDENDEILELLLEAGADVTLQTAESSKTVVHIAHDLFIEDNVDEFSSMIEILLEAQDSNVNPTCIDGFSHLYIACRFCSLAVVQKLLNNTNIDVNQRLSDFYPQFGVDDVDRKLHHSLLHLVAGGTFVRDDSEFQKLELLMKRGANVHAEDQHGETPLHDCARWSSAYGIKYFETLARGGADVNARNIYGSTPLDVYLAESYNRFTVERMIILLSLGCRFNAINTVDGSGTVAQISSVFSFEDMKKLLIDLSIIFPQEMEIDNIGRSILQNLVSSKDKHTAEEYCELIEEISTYPSCDVDHQDNLGRTALHMAAELLNVKAISALLLAGADVNIIDFQGKAPVSSDFILDRNTQENGKVFTWVVHLKKLKLCRLDVERENEDFLQAFEKLNGTTALSNAFFEEIENLKNLKIEPHAPTVFDFLSETGVVAAYPRMPLGKREDVIKFFSPSRKKFLRKEFPETASIIALQWRKARARQQIVNSAEIALLVMTESALLPEIYSIILTFLSNADLKSLIASL